MDETALAAMQLFYDLPSQVKKTDEETEVVGRLKTWLDGAVPGFGKNSSYGYKPLVIVGLIKVGCFIDLCLPSLCSCSLMPTFM